MPAHKQYKKGQVLEIPCQGLIYKTPPLPELKTIRGFDLPIKDQVWFRDETYLQWDWNIDPSQGDLWWNIATQEQRDWFDLEIERIHAGSWIMINGNPTYFNADCYFFHQIFVLQEGIYPSYKETSLEYFYFYQLCDDDPGCLGECGIKGRRVGLSSMSASIKLRIAITENNTLSGIVSKTGTDAQEMFFFIKNGLENLPPFLMPDLNKSTESEIHVAKPVKKITAKNARAVSDKGKNNRVNYLDTAENAYDGRRMRHVTLDEAGKWSKVNVLITLSKISDTLSVGSSVIGHISVFSTVNKGDKGGENFRVIWDGSDHVSGAKDSIGRTRTKMKRFFIAGYRGLNGYVGKYGESIVESPTEEQKKFLQTHVDPTTGRLACQNPNIGAKEYILETRKMYENDPELLAEERRKFPFEWKEVFEGANNRCNFNLEELKEQIHIVEGELEKLGRSPVNGENGRRGYFKKPDGEVVKWVDSSSGMWYILDFPEQGAENKWQNNDGIRCPANCIYGAAGLDPFAHSQSTVDKGSDACLIIHKRYNVLDASNSNMPVAMFLGRPQTKPEFFNQIYWGIEFYGIKLLGEGMPTDWIDHAVKPSVRLASPINHIKKIGYLLTTKRSDKKEIYGINPQDKEAREQHLTEMVEYAQNNMHKIRFMRLLKDMLDFDVNNRTLYDACMAWGYALIGLREHVNAEIEAPREEQFIRTFNLYRRTAS